MKKIQLAKILKFMTLAGIFLLPSLAQAKSNSDLEKKDVAPISIEMPRESVTNQFASTLFLIAGSGTPGGVIIANNSSVVTAKNVQATLTGLDLTQDASACVSIAPMTNCTLQIFPGTTSFTANVPISGTNTTATSVTVAVVSAKLNQTITFTSTAPTTAIPGDTYTPTATATSGLPVTITVDASSTSVCSINSMTGVVTFNMAGTCTLDANQAGNTVYNPAPQVQQPVTVKNAQATLTAIATPPTIVYLGTSALSTAGGSGTGAVTYAVMTGGSNCSITGTTLTGTGVGTCTVVATKAADTNYQAASSAPITVTVNQAPQATLNAIATPSTIVYQGTSALSSTGGSGTGAVTYAVMTGGSNCSITGTTLTGTGVGTCTVVATKAADANYLATNSAPITVTVNQAPQATLNAFATPSTIVYQGTSALSSTGGSGTGAVTYAVMTGGSNCSITGTTLTGIGVGTCTVVATKAADANYLATNSAPITVTVNMAPQTISYTPPLPIGSYGNGDTYQAGATSTSGLLVTITIDPASAGLCTIDGSNLVTITTFIFVSICTLNANQAGDANYLPATTQNLDIQIFNGALAGPLPSMKDQNNTNTDSLINANTSNNLNLIANPYSFTQTNAPYLQTHTVVKGTEPYIFSVLSGALPAGTLLDPTTGTVSGTPIRADDFAYIIQVTDAKGTKASAATSGFVSTSVLNLSPSSINLQKGAVGQEITITNTSDVVLENVIASINGDSEVIVNNSNCSSSLAAMDSCIIELLPGSKTETDTTAILSGAGVQTPAVLSITVTDAVIATENTSMVLSLNDAKTISINNSGTTIANDVGYSSSRLLPPEIKITPEQCGPIAPGETCILTISLEGIQNMPVLAPIVLTISGTNTNSLKSLVNIINDGKG